MFGRKPPGTGEPQQPVERIAPTPFQQVSQRQTPPVGARAAPTLDSDALPPRPTPVLGAVSSSPPAQPIPQPQRRPAEPVREVRKLLVGRDITLSGEIAACDHLIVEGTVEAGVRDCHRMEVSENGLFRGAVDIGEAEIAGRFEGQLTVQGRLVIRSTGRVEGRIQYGELSVEAGGTLDGEVHFAGKPAPKPAAKPIVPPPAPLLESVAPPADEPASVKPAESQS